MAQDVEELKNLLTLSRRIEMKFGVCVASKPEDMVLLLDKKKPPAMLAKLARKASKGNITTYGTCETAGKLITLKTEEDDPPPGISKKLRKYLAGNGLRFSIEVLLPGGASFESDTDEEDQPDDASEADLQDADGDDPAKAKWMQVRSKLAPAVKTALTNAGSNAKDVATVWTFMEGKAKEGAYDTALKAVPKLAEILKSGAATPVEAPAAETPPAAPTQDPEIGKRLKATIADAKQAIAANRDLKANVLAAINAVTNAWKAGDMGATTQELDALAALISGPQEAVAPDTPQTSKINPKDLANDLRDLWDDARGTTDKQLEGLLRKIAQEDGPQAKMIADLGLTAWSKGANTELMTSILELSASSDSNLKKAAKRAADACASYNTFLTMHPAVEVMDNNPMGQAVTLRATLGGALKEMRKRALAAHAA